MWRTLLAKGQEKYALEVWPGSFRWILMRRDTLTREKSEGGVKEKGRTSDKENDNYFSISGDSEMPKKFHGIPRLRSLPSLTYLRNCSAALFEELHAISSCSNLESSKIKDLIVGASTVGPRNKDIVRVDLDRRSTEKRACEESMAARNLIHFDARPRSEEQSVGSADRDRGFDGS
ncbi:hypothetical protein K0M31_014299 [Melipona bicolor]|uniref:Uncharacterized protein n=1 Tax=Melipona bicolor TaxID=60889 RepID=A0AA40KU60_9HYME|nr:hypothetical protein K0M31_014299 [Melipona bicolor]